MTPFTVTSSTPGTYTNGITVNVNDGRGGTASGSASLTVNACGADGQPACATGCNAGNVNVGGICYIDCQLNSASISGSSCTGTNGCQVGESVTLSATYTGACLYRNINNIQVDSTNNPSCRVEYNPANSNVDNQFNKNGLTGLENLHSGTTRTISITGDSITNIDQTCISQTVSATAGAFRNGVPPATPNVPPTSIIHTSLLSLTFFIFSK